MINISKACGYRLRQYVEALEGKNYVFIHNKMG